jgi:hypothetical protein
MPQVHHRGGCWGAKQAKSCILGSDKELAVFKAPPDEAFIKSPKPFEAAAVQRHVAWANTPPPEKSRERPDTSETVEDAAKEGGDVVDLPLLPKPQERMQREVVGRHSLGKSVLRELPSHQDATATGEALHLRTRCMPTNE